MLSYKIRISITSFIYTTHGTICNHNYWISFQSIVRQFQSHWLHMNPFAITMHWFSFNPQYFNFISIILTTHGSIIFRKTHWVCPYQRPTFGPIPQDLDLRTNIREMIRVSTNIQNHVTISGHGVYCDLDYHWS